MKLNNLTIFQISLLGLLVIFGVMLFYLSQKQVIGTKKMEAEVNQLFSAQQKLAQINADLPNLSGEESTWMKSLPSTENDVAVFASQIEATAKSNGITVTINFDDFPKPMDVNGKKVTGLGLDITLDGSFAGATGFMDALGKLPYFVKIDKLTITQKETHHGIKATLSGALMMRERSSQ